MRRVAGRRGWVWFGMFLTVVAVGTLVLAAWMVYLDREITAQFDGRRWDVPAQVYARPVELFVGKAITVDAFAAELRRLGYREVSKSMRAGTFHRSGQRGGGRIDLVSRRFQFWDGEQQVQRVVVGIDGGKVFGLRVNGENAALARLDPLLIGSIFPAHGEDRLIVRPDEVPPLLPAGLKAVEDQRFDMHPGVDPLGILRAAWVNIRAGAKREGASTLTQQLVRSYFLTTERTFSRKVIEALMAIILELRYTKRDLMNAYINEVFLGQEGERAIHGFGLASQFYFGKPLAELQPHEVATLIALVRGPSYYNPRSHAERAHARRDLVLKVMAERGVIDASTRDRAIAAPFTVLDRPSRNTVYYPAFMDLVRRQLGDEYDDQALTQVGLRIFTTLDPFTQATLEQSLSKGVERLQRQLPRRRHVELEGAGVVTTVQGGEVLAIVGGRRAGFAGYNRALDARRQIGSLVKPALYTAAFAQRRYHLASVLDDAPLTVELGGGKTWQPQNYEGRHEGPQPVVRALAASSNPVAVRGGWDTGIDDVADLVERMSGHRKVQRFPALLLGAVELTPFEVAQMYNTQANLGFRTPLRAVKAVVDAKGKPLDRFTLELEQVVQSAAAYQVNEAMVQVMQRGTARSAAPGLPAGVVFAGKTGTTNDFRDSWFAGFSGDHVAVIWLGDDRNKVTGFSGSRGALAIWAPLMAALPNRSYDPPLAPGMEQQWVDFATGLGALEGCGDAVMLPLPTDTRLPMKPECVLGVEGGDPLALPGELPGTPGDGSPGKAGEPGPAAPPASEPRKDNANPAQRMRTWLERMFE